MTLSDLIATFTEINSILAQDPDAGGVALKACNVEYYQDQLDAMTADYGLPKNVAEEFLAWLTTQA